MDKELLTPAEFEAKYNVSHTTFYREVNAGRIPIIKIGRATRVTRSAGEKWLAQKEQEAEDRSTDNGLANTSHLDTIATQNQRTNGRG